MRFGCIGLGRIGAPVAAHLAAVGHEVVAYDIRPGKEEELRELGIRWNTIAVLAAGADVIINCVLTRADVQAVIGGADGVAAHARPGTVFIEMTTLSPEETMSNAALLAERGIRYLDCPVSGGADGAQRGELVLIVGGDAATLDEVRPGLACCTKQQVFHVGEVGAGSTMKAIVQAIFLSHMASFLEAISLGKAAGLPYNKQLEVLAATTSHHPTLGKRYQQIVDGDFKPRFEIASALKDLKIVRELAERVDFTAELADCSYARYQKASDAGYTNEDLIALLRLAN